MPSENETEATQEDAQNAGESIFGDETPKLAAAAVEVQEAKDETGQEQPGPDDAENQIAEDESGPADDPAGGARVASPRT